MKANSVPQDCNKLGDLSAALIVLAEYAPERMTLAQGVFFLRAAVADLAGSPATFTAIRSATGDAVSRSLHTTYKVLLDGSKRKDRPNQSRGLGWLTRVTNPADEREKFLTLTPKGREVLREVLTASAGNSLT